jgi:hypothetical protein
MSCFFVISCGKGDFYVKKAFFSIIIVAFLSLKSYYLIFSPLQAGRLFKKAWIY